jgi:hypothetical protein
MFDTIEVRKAANGYILSVTTENETEEFVYETTRKVMRTIKGYLDLEEKEPTK